MDVDVIIPALNEAGNIAQLVYEAAAQPVARVIVVDNGSTDGTVPWLLKPAPTWSLSRGGVMVTPARPAPLPQPAISSSFSTATSAPCPPR